MPTTPKGRRVKAPPRLRLERGGSDEAMPAPTPRDAHDRIRCTQSLDPYAIILVGTAEEGRPVFRFEMPHAWLTPAVGDFFARVMEEGGFDGLLERHGLPARPPRPRLTIEGGGLS